MSELTLGEVIEITQGTPFRIPDLSKKVAGAAYDSREVKPNYLFAAFQGQNTDGHNFAPAAIAAGAIATLASHEVDGPCILVSDVRQALILLASANRKKLSVPVLAITGSSGKTTTKDLLIDLMLTRGKVVATAGSRNNELGLPITLLSADYETKSIILEMGARHKGNIHELVQIAQPNIVGITNIGSAHLGEFGSIDQIVNTKSEILESLDANGIAVLNADQEVSDQIALRTRGQVRFAGLSKRAQVRVTNMELDENAKPKFKLELDGDEILIQLNIVGRHQASNAAIAAAMAAAAGITPAEIQAALNSAHTRSDLRMAVALINEITFIDDSYNANPESVAAGLEVIASLGGVKRRIAILGEMAELGEASDELHRQLGQLAAKHVSLLLTCGSSAKLITDGAIAAGLNASQARVFDNPNLIVEFLRHEMDAGDALLIKASRAAKFDLIAQQLRDIARDRGRTA